MEELLFTYSDEDVRRLIVRSYPRLKSFICRFMHCDVAEAEDVLQDALLKLIEKRAAVASSKIDGYLYRTVRNLCLNKMQRGMEASTVSLDSSSPWDIIAAADFEGWSPSENREPDTCEVLSYAETLSPRTRDVFMKSRVEGMTHKEIAQEEGISERAVEKHLQKSVLAFRHRFKQN